MGGSRRKSADSDSDAGSDDGREETATTIGGSVSAIVGMIIVITHGVKPPKCSLCGGCSTHPSPFDTASSDDEYGGLLAWAKSLILTMHHNLIQGLFI